MAEQYSGIHPQVSIQHLNIVFKAYGRNISAKEIFFKKIFLSFEIIIQYIILPFYLPQFSLHCFSSHPIALSQIHGFSFLNCCCISGSVAFISMS